MQILDGQHERSSPAPLEAHAPEGLEDPRPDRLRAEVSQEIGARGHPQEVEQEGRAAVRVHADLRQRELHLRGDGLRRVAGLDARVGPHDVEDREVRRRGTERQAAPLQEGHPLAAEAAPELEEEPGLPQPRLRQHVERLAMTRPGRGQRLEQPRELDVAADEGREAALGEPVERRTAGADAHQAVGGHGRALALERERSDGLESRIGAHQARGRLAHEDLPRLGELPAVSRPRSRYRRRRCGRRGAPPRRCRRGRCPCRSPSGFAAAGRARPPATRPGAAGGGRARRGRRGGRDPRAPAARPRVRGARRRGTC